MNFLQKSKKPKDQIEPEPSYSRSETGAMWSEIKDFLWETFKVIVISLAIIIPVRYFLIQPFYVQGASMEPSFFDNEYLIIDEISYRFEKPARGDIAVFRYPRDPKQFFIKRIIGLPGETLSLRNGRISIKPPVGPAFNLDEAAYLEAGLVTAGSVNIELGSDEYYVLGDNRASSLDSRSFGPVELEALIGKVWLRGWPLDRIMVFEQPNYE